MVASAFGDGLEESTISYIASLIMVTMAPIVFSLGIGEGLLFLVITLGLMIKSFFDSVNDLRTKGFLWSCGFCLGLAVLDINLLLALIAVVVLYKYCSYQSDKC